MYVCVMQESEREEFNVHKRQCEMEQQLMEQERARLLQQHAPQLLGHLPPVCIAVYNRRRRPNLQNFLRTLEKSS